MYVHIDMAAMNTVLSLLEFPSQVQYKQVTLLHYAYIRATFQGAYGLIFLPGIQNLTHEHLTQYKGVHISKILAFRKFSLYSR